MKTNFILLLAISAIPAACSSTPKHTTVTKPPREQLRSVQLTTEDTRRVRTGENVKTYHVGRSPSGNGGRVMHEAHRVYRVEKPNRWNLARNQPPLASTGPTNKLIDPAFRPAPDSKAIQAELNRQREIGNEIAETREALIDTLGSARARLYETIEDAEVSAVLRQEVSDLREENQKLRSGVSSPSLPAKEASESPTETLRKWGKTLNGKPE